MKILYDHQIFSSQEYGGISRYFYELMSRFSDDAEVNFELALRYSNNSYLRNAAFTQCKAFFPVKKFFGKTTVLNTFNDIESRRSIRSGNFDIFHPTYYHPYFLPFVGTRPVVVTVYDMTHELYPELFSANDRTIAWKKMVLGRATGIIAISENTKRDLLKFYRVDEKQITVVPLANSLPRSRRDTLLPDLPDRYLLYVGQRSGYKNFPFFIRALVPVMRDNPDLAVVCAGGGSFTSQEVDMLACLGGGARVRQFPASDDVLAALYEGAAAFVFPSLYEGFGIPVLEAFSSGCPVLLSNVSSLPEIAGDAALFFDPEDEKSLRSAVERVVGDADLKESLTARGREKAREFSWDKVARETKAVYESLL